MGEGVLDSVKGLSTHWGREDVSNANKVKVLWGEHPQPTTLPPILTVLSGPLPCPPPLWWMDCFIGVNGKWDLFWPRLSSSYLWHESEKDFKWPWRNYRALQWSGIFTPGIRLEGLFRLLGDCILRAAGDLKYKYVFHACLSYCLLVTESSLATASERTLACMGSVLHALFLKNFFSLEIFRNFCRMTMGSFPGLFQLTFSVVKFVCITYFVLFIHIWVYRSDKFAEMKNFSIIL